MGSGRCGVTALLLVAVASAIVTAAWLAARRRREPAQESAYVGRHTGGYLLDQIAKAAEGDDLMTYSREIRTRVVAAQKAVEQLTGRRVT